MVENGAHDFRKRIERIKQNVTMADLVRHYGGEVWDETRACQIRCIFPDHDDKNPSARIFSDSNVLHCFVCGFHGDVIDVVQKYQNCDRLVAIQYLEENFTLDDVILPEKVKTGWDLETLERKLDAELRRNISSKLWSLFERIPEHKRYIWWIVSDWIWEVYDNSEIIGGVVPWYYMARNYISKMLHPLVREFDSLILHGKK